MTVLADDTDDRFTISGVGPYAFSFRIFDATDLQVTVCSSASPAVPTLLAYLTDYTVNGVNDDDGGTVTLVTGREVTYAGYTLDIRSDTPNEQPTSIRNQGRFLPEIHEDALDYLSRQIQDMRRQQRASFRYPDNVLSDGMLTPLVAWTSKYLTIDANGVLTPAVLSSSAVTSAVITSLLAASTTDQDALLALIMERSDTSPALTRLKRTPAEITAGVMPLNFSYDELHIMRYGLPGTLGLGVVNDVAAFNAASAVARIGGGVIVVDRPPVQYVLMGPWNLTCGNTIDPQHGFIIRGENAGYDNNVSAHILIKHTGHAFDCAGTNSVWVRDLVIATDATVYPQTGVFQARMAGTNNSQIYREQNVIWIGKFSKCIKYNYGSEQGSAVGCLYYNNATDAGASVVVTTAWNILSLTSTFITVATGERSTICHRHTNCEFFMNSTNATADVFKLDNANHFMLRDCFVDSRGRSMVYVDPTNGPSSFGRISGMDGENSSPLPTYGIFFGAAGATSTPTGWEIEHSYIPSTTRAIFGGANVVLDNFQIRNIGEQASKGLQAETVTSSYIYGVSLVSIVNSTRNEIHGFGGGMTLTNPVNQMKFDTFTGNITITGSIGVLGATPTAGVGGFGTPTGPAVISNFPGATATLVQTSQTVAEILTVLKSIGFIST